MGPHKKHPLVHLKMKHKFHKTILTLLCVVHSDVFYCYFNIVQDLLNYVTTHYWVAAGSLRGAALEDGCYPLHSWAPPQPRLRCQK